MNDLILILIAALIVISVGLPFVNAYSKWKKVMNDVEAEEKGDSDVC